MRVVVVCAILSAVVLAGCAENSEPTPVEDDTFDDVEVEVTDETGAIRGVVVDQSITPVEGALVTFVHAGREMSAMTDAEGRFAFSKIEPGTYFLTVTKLNYDETQSTVTVEAGIEQPPIVKVQLNRLFDENPYMEQFTFNGFFNCAYRIPISSTCVNDYTRICTVYPPCCPGGCFPELARLVDTREYITQLEAGWQTFVVEAVWEPSLAGTSNELGMTVSYAARQGASHNWGGAVGENPLYYRTDVLESPSEFPGDIPKEGLEDLFIFFASGSFPSLSVQQSFEVFHTEFFYGKPPEGWSLVAGDGNPF